MLPLDEESRLVALAQKGDQNAFASLVAAYKGPLYNLALRMTGARAESEDIVQESFLRAYGALHRFNNNRRFYSWLYTICINAVRDFLRTRRYHAAQIDATVLNAVPCNRPIPEQTFQHVEQSNTLLGAVETLPPPLREVIILRFFQELPFSDVAAICGITENAAKKRAYTAITKLHKILDHSFSVHVFTGGDNNE